MIVPAQAKICHIALTKLTDTPALRRRTMTPQVRGVENVELQNMSGDGEQEYFADRISDGIIIALSKLSQLFIIARNWRVRGRRSRPAKARACPSHACCLRFVRVFNSVYFEALRTEAPCRGPRRHPAPNQRPGGARHGRGSGPGRWVRASHRRSARSGAPSIPGHPVYNTEPRVPGPGRSRSPARSNPDVRATTSLVWCGRAPVSVKKIPFATAEFSLSAEFRPADQSKSAATFLNRRSSAQGTTRL
jgi:hypothetical protein